jgi:hypothetical protein
LSLLQEGKERRLAAGKKSAVAWSMDGLGLMGRKCTYLDEMSAGSGCVSRHNDKTPQRERKTKQKKAACMLVVYLAERDDD